MANEQNLRPGEYKFSHEESVKGGKASAEARRRKKALRELVQLAFERPIKDKKTGKTIRTDEAMVLKQIEKALKGDTRAFTTLRDTAGEMPVQQVEVATIDPETYQRIESLLSED